MIIILFSAGKDEEKINMSEFSSKTLVFICTRTTCYWLALTLEKRQMQDKTTESFRHL
jgi:hypothetical protein